jgi:hypothetical protein
MDKVSAVVSVLVVAALTAVTPAGANATGPMTFGASLSQAPDVTFDCSVIPYATPIPSPATSCTWGTPLFDVSSQSAGGLDAPGNGDVYQVKLRVGASTGPMQLVVLRTLFDPNDLSSNQCCVDVAQSSVFTPVANGITTLNVDLPVGEGQESDNGATVDFLDQIGLSILEDGVAVPVIDETGLEATEQQPVVNFNAPALSLGESQLAGDPDGYELDMQATWYPSGQSPATIVFPARTDSVKGNNALVRVGCTSAPCDGTVTVTGPPVATKAAAIARASKSVTYARGAFKLTAGATSDVPAKLTSKGRALAGKHRKLKVTITVKLTNLSPAKTFTHTLRLKF